jgi:DNA-binding NtrC family response regulator
MILAHEGTITTEHLPVRLRSSRINENQKPVTGIGLDDNLKVMQANLEKELILDALMKTNYSRTETARLLKISRKTLFNKMKIYDL